MGGEGEGCEGRVQGGRGGGREEDGKAVKRLSGSLPYAGGRGMTERKQMAWRVAMDGARPELRQELVCTRLLRHCDNTRR